MAKTASLKVFHLVLFSTCFQSPALNMKLLSFLIKTCKLIRAFNNKKSKIFYILCSMISLCFEYLWILTNAKEYFVWCNLFWIFQDLPWEKIRGLAVVHHEAFKAAQNPTRRVYSREQLLQKPSDAFLNDCDVIHYNFQSSFHWIPLSFLLLRN